MEKKENKGEKSTVLVHIQNLKTSKLTLKQCSRSMCVYHSICICVCEEAAERDMVNQQINTPLPPPPTVTLQRKKINLHLGHRFCSKRKINLHLGHRFCSKRKKNQPAFGPQVLQQKKQNQPAFGLQVLQQKKKKINLHLGHRFCSKRKKINLHLGHRFCSKKKKKKSTCIWATGFAAKIMPQETDLYQTTPAWLLLE